MKKNFTYLKSMLLVMLLCIGSMNVWGQINLSNDVITLDKFSSFSGSGYKDVLDYKINDYSGFKVTKCMLSSKDEYLQMQATNGALTSPAIISNSGFIIEVTYTSAQSLTLKIGEEAAVTNNSVLTAETTNTNTTFKLSAGSKFATIQSIKITPKVGSSIASPTISLESGTYYDSQTITLTAPEADGIYYTTDVTKDPKTEGTLYTNPFIISETTTVKAVAKKGEEFSNIVSANFIIFKLTATLPYNIDFKTGFGNCFVKKISGDTEWQSTNTGASINGYNKGNCESWIISPAVTAKDIAFTFKSGTQYEGKSLILLYSTDYDPITMNNPNDATWIDITTKAVWPTTGSALSWANSGDITLNKLSSSIRIAFKYVGDNKLAALWQVTDFKIVNATPVTEIAPGDIGSETNLSQEVTASGDWTQDNIDNLAIVISENKTPVTSVTFTGSINNDVTDEIVSLSPNCLKIFANGVVVPTSWTTNVVKLDADGNATSENIALTDGLPFKTSQKIVAANVSFKRDGLTANKKSTIYLPFATTLSDGTVAYTFDKVENNKVKFVSVSGNTLAANTPYLIEPKGASLDITGASVDILPEEAGTTPTGYAFLGTYTKIDAVGLYGFKNGEFAKGIAGATVPAFRAYLQATNIAGAPATLSIDIDGDATNIETVNNEGMNIYFANGNVNITADKAQQINIYGVDGRLVRSERLNEGNNIITGLVKGIYIVNNKKVVVR